MKRGQKQKAFTIVELLIVIVVIGILAALVVAVFNGARSRATVSSVKTDAGKLAKALELQKTEGALPVSLDTSASGLSNMKLSGPNQIAKYTAVGSGYRACVIAVEGGTTTAYAIYDSSGGLVDSGVGAGPSADCTPPPPEFVNGIRCPVITFGTPFALNATENRVAVIYDDATIARITRIDTDPVTNVYIDQGALRRHTWLKSEGLNWNDVTMNVRGSNGSNRTDCRVTFSWPAE